MINNFKEMTILITGGTKGIGLATVDAYVSLGSKVFATYLWGDTFDEVEARYSECDNKPIFLQSDASSEEATASLIQTIKEQTNKIDVFVSNVAFAPAFDKKYDYQSMKVALDHNTWPLINYCDSLNQAFGAYPRYIIALTSEGHRSYYLEKYDYVAISKSMLETVVKYVSCRENTRINCVSPGFVDTEAFELVFGKRASRILKKNNPEFVIKAEEIAKVIVALSSGLMDAVNGQVIQADRGQMFADNFFKWIDFIDDGQESEE